VQERHDGLFLMAVRPLAGNLIYPRRVATVIAIERGLRSLPKVHRFVQ
jgi:hypothetical protein